MTPAEEARRLVAATTSAALATLSDDGAPWASHVVFATLPDGAPVLCLSTLAEHGRNLLRDPRASLLVVEQGGDDPLARGRVTLAGVAERPVGGHALECARRAYGDAEHTAFADCAFWILSVQRVRWVGGFGQMATVAPAEYAKTRIVAGELPTRSAD